MLFLVVICWQTVQNMIRLTLKRSTIRVYTKFVDTCLRIEVKNEINCVLIKTSVPPDWKLQITYALSITSYLPQQTAVLDYDF